MVGRSNQTHLAAKSINRRTFYVLDSVAITLNITKDTKGENSSQKPRNFGSGIEVK
jgi:hypothetical protein